MVYLAMKRRIPYGIGNYAELVEKICYFVDKIPYLALLEGVQNPVFLRPCRFGKSLFCSLLRWYYDLNAAPRFAELFGDTWTGQHPTGSQNSYARIEQFVIHCFGNHGFRVFAV